MIPSEVRGIDTLRDISLDAALGHYGFPATTTTPGH
jgi:hypothetical protein